MCSQARECGRTTAAVTSPVRGVDVRPLGLSDDADSDRVPVPLLMGWQRKASTFVDSAGHHNMGSNLVFLVPIKRIINL